MVASCERISILRAQIEEQLRSVGRLTLEAAVMELAQRTGELDEALKELERLREVAERESMLLAQNTLLSQQLQTANQETQHWKQALNNARRALECSATGVADGVGVMQHPSAPQSSLPAPPLLLAPEVKEPRTPFEVVQQIRREKGFDISVRCFLLFFFFFRKLLFAPSYHYSLIA